MIYIVENKPKALTGLSSLFVTFTFNKDIINLIKCYDTYNYDPNTKEWELLPTSLSYLLDNLVYYDDITLKLLDDNEEYKEIIKPKLQYKTKPLDHQFEGIEFGLNHNKWLLLDAPGLGKTLQTIYLAEELKARGEIEHCLILCGINTLKTNWKKEIEKHSNLSCTILGARQSSTGKMYYNSIEERAKQLKEKIDEFFIITNIETIRDNKVIDALKKSKNKIDMIILDEAHKCKGWSSTQGKNLLKLKNYKYKVACTGTLLLNSPLDAYVPLKWIDIEHGDVTRFKQTYCVYGGVTGKEIIGYKNIDILKGVLDTCALRRTKDILGDKLPPKNIITEIVEMNSEHRKFYDNIKDGIKDECDKIEFKKNNLLALTVRLRQATSCPQVLTSKNIVSSKIERCLELVDELVSQGEKVVIFSQFKDPVYQLQQLLTQYNPLIGTGDMDDGEFSRNVDLFQNDDTHMIMIGTSDKMGTGITLNRASYAICIDCEWTDAVQTQCEDRIHRIGSTSPVFIYRLMCEDTIDMVVEQILHRKKAISDFIVDDAIIDDESYNIILDYIRN